MEQTKFVIEKCVLLAFYSKLQRFLDRLIGSSKYLAVAERTRAMWCVRSQSRRRHVLSLCVDLKEQYAYFDKLGVCNYYFYLFYSRIVHVQTLVATALPSYQNSMASRCLANYGWQRETVQRKNIHLLEVLCATCAASLTLMTLAKKSMASPCATGN